MQPIFEPTTTTTHYRVMGENPYLHTEQNLVGHLCVGVLLDQVLVVGALLRSWQRHRDAHVLQKVLRVIGRTLPATVLLENVAGLKLVDAGSDISPLKLVQDTLLELGYSSKAIDLDMCTWHQVTRKRVYILACHKNYGGTACLQRALTLVENALYFVSELQPVKIDALLLPESDGLDRKLSRLQVNSLRASIPLHDKSISIDSLVC
eukprot:2270909-Amphidinium_carterae.2